MNFCSPHSYLASLDIKSLYMNIRFDMPIKVFLKIFTQQEKFVLYLKLLKICYKKNNIFQFNGKIYHQICGIAMGTKLAPA